MENVAVNSMETFVNSLETGLSAGEIWGVLGTIAGFIVIVTLVAVGRRIVNKNLSSVKNGKAGRV